MNLLLDTHLLLWAASDPARLSADARAAIEDERHTLHFSVASLWEVVIKGSLGRSDFSVNPATLRRGLLDNGYRELAIAGSHVLAVEGLPALHRDPFDRVLVAQAMVEGYPLLTADRVLSGYGSAVRLV